MQAVIGLAMDTGPWSAGSITTLTPRSTMHTAAYLDSRAAECDRLQRDNCEGPARDAVLFDPVQVAGDLASDHRWPRWSAAAIDRGIRQVMTLRLFTDRTWGTINLYATRPGLIDGSMVRDARVIAAHGSVLVAKTITEGQLKQAIATRGLIGQAQGILMRQYRLNPSRAFAVLRRTSQRHNTKITAIAEQLVTTGTTPGLDVHGEQHHAPTERPAVPSKSATQPFGGRTS